MLTQKDVFEKIKSCASRAIGDLDYVTIKGEAEVLRVAGLFVAALNEELNVPAGLSASTPEVSCECVEFNLKLTLGDNEEPIVSTVDIHLGVFSSQFLVDETIERAKLIFLYKEGRSK